MTKPLRIDTMASTSKKGAIATKYVENYLRGKPETIDVKNVESIKHYQNIDIDILWTFSRKNNTPRELSIEVKGDKYFETGNYFFETFSNKERNTPGCFLYSQADYFYYYFLEKELHILPLEATRNWFLERIEEFPEKSTQTKLKNGFYTTVGRPVARRRVLKEVKGVHIIPYAAEFDQKAGS